MTKKGERGFAARSSHLGYDCYKTGSINNGQGNVRIILRSIRLPPSVTEEMRAILPTEMWWPEQDHSGAHACIDSVLGCAIGSLRGWKNAWPDHVFGFERYIEWLERKAHGKRGAGGPGKLSPIQLTKFPAQVVGIEPLSKAEQEDGTRIAMALVRFADGKSAVRLTLYAMPVLFGLESGAPLKLSRAMIDVISGEFDIVEHYPGRYTVVGLPPTLIHTILGVRPFNMKRRVSASERPRAVEEIPPLPDSRERQVATNAAAPARKASAEVFFESFPTAPKPPKVRTTVKAR